MNTSIRKRIIYPVIQLMRGERVLEELPKMLETEHFDRERLAKFQFNQLKNLIWYSYQNVPYYHKVFSESGITPDDIQSNEDFEKIPVLTKQVLRDNMKDMVDRNYRDAIESRKTSGSTGYPLEILKGRDSLSRIRAIMFRYYNWYDIDICDRQLRLTGEAINLLARISSHIQDILLNKLRVNTNNLSEDILMRKLNKVIKFQPDYIYGYPSAIYNYKIFLEKIGCRRISPRVIITTGECLNPSHRKGIEDFFGCRVVNEYGCSESGIIAFECPEGNMHVSDDNLYVEILHEGDVARPTGSVSESGPILITELFNYSIPLIRYRIGDIGRIDSDTSCACGRAFRIFKEIKGRESEVIQLANGKRVHSEIFDFISDALVEKGIRIMEYKITQKTSSFFEIELVCERAKTDQVKLFINEMLRNKLGENIEITYKIVDKVERDPSGKFRCFVPMKCP